jgi:hypothetical protein
MIQTLKKTSPTKTSLFFSIFPINKSNSNRSHPQVVIITIFVKTEKTFSNNSPSKVVIYPKLGKIDSASVYMRAAIRCASSRVTIGEGYKNNLSFQEVDR